MSTTIGRAAAKALQVAIPATITHSLGRIESGNNPTGRLGGQPALCMYQQPHGHSNLITQDNLAWLNSTMTDANTAMRDAMKAEQDMETSGLPASDKKSFKERLNTERQQLKILFGNMLNSDEPVQSSIATGRQTVQLNAVTAEINRGITTSRAAMAQVLAPDHETGLAAAAGILNNPNPAPAGQNIVHHVHGGGNTAGTDAGGTLDASDLPPRIAEYLRSMGHNI